MVLPVENKISFGKVLATLFDSFGLMISQIEQIQQSPYVCRFYLLERVFERGSGVNAATDVFCSSPPFYPKRIF